MIRDYDRYDATGLAELVRTRQVSASELLEEALRRAALAQERVNCFSSIKPEMARAQAVAPLSGPFAGVPMAMKDLGAEIAGFPMTSGCRANRSYVAAADSELVARYRAAGFVFFGTTTTPEFGITATTESALFGATRNPWDLTRSSGGSSGGASACVASGVIPLAHASDGGGSVRIPAACTGLVGLKPSRGRIPMGPKRTEGWNGLSTVHCVSRSVRDTAALLDISHGREAGSRYVAPEPATSFLEASQRDPKRLRIALWTRAPNDVRPDSDAMAGLKAASKLLHDLGHEIEEASPDIDGAALGRGMVAVLAGAMAAMCDQREAELGRKLMTDELEPVTWRFVEMGRTFPIAENAKADLAFMKAAQDYENFLIAGRYDVVLAPTLSRAPETLGVLTLSPSSMDDYTQAVTTYAPWCPIFNQSGAPAISLPLHWTQPSVQAPQGLPLGMMLGARYGEEALLLSLAGQIERAAPWAHRRAPFGVWTH
jgi:amidase/6-aminohexanoate-cyclic-dimer hydrolase